MKKEEENSRVCPLSLAGIPESHIFSNSMHCGEDECQWWDRHHKCCVVWVIEHRLTVRDNLNEHRKEQLTLHREHNRLLRVLTERLQADSVEDVIPDEQPYIEYLTRNMENV